MTLQNLPNHDLVKGFRNYKYGKSNEKSHLFYTSVQCPLTSNKGVHTQEKNWTFEQQELSIMSGRKSQ